MQVIFYRFNHKVAVSERWSLLACEKLPCEMFTKFWPVASIDIFSNYSSAFELLLSLCDSGNINNDGIIP